MIDLCRAEVNEPNYRWLNIPIANWASPSGRHTNSSGRQNHSTANDDPGLSRGDAAKVLLSDNNPFRSRRAFRYCRGVRRGCPLHRRCQATRTISAVLRALKRFKGRCGCGFRRSGGLNLQDRHDRIYVALENGGLATACVVGTARSQCADRFCLGDSIQKVGQYRNVAVAGGYQLDSSDVGGREFISR